MGSILTDEQIRIEVAELCGWKREKFISPLDNQTDLYLWRTVKGKRLVTMLVTMAVLPDYPRDLNAAMEFAKHLASLGWRCVANMGLDGTWECFFTQTTWSQYPQEGDHYGAGPTLAKAICEAGLRTLKPQLFEGGGK